MATFIVGLIVAVALYYACRHVVRNFRDGKEDCCGGTCPGCTGSCKSCHPGI